MATLVKEKNHSIETMEISCTNPMSLHTVESIEATEKSSTTPDSSNTAQSIEVIEKSLTSTNIGEKISSSDEKDQARTIPSSPVHSISSDRSESSLLSWQLDLANQTNNPYPSQNIFDVLDDPELNLSSEDVRDDVSNDFPNISFGVEMEFSTNSTSFKDQDSLITYTDFLDNSFNISGEIPNQNSPLNSSDYVVPSDISNTINTTANDSTVSDHAPPKISTKAGSIDNSKLVARPKENARRQDFCYFCKKMQTVISRHIENVHGDVPEVKQFSALPKNNPIRVQIIDSLRKKGNHLYNTSPEYNKDGNLLVARKPKEERAGTEYACCHNCCATLSKKSIRRHRQKCVGASIKGDRANTILSRRADGRLHGNASPQLQRIFAVFNEDFIIQLIRYDELLIEFGNGMAEKYKKDQQQAMIRNRLRTLGRLLHQMKENRRKDDPIITNFASIYDPGLYDCMLRAVNILARFNEETGEHEIPSIVTSLGTYIKAVAEVALLVVRKKKDRETQLLLEDYIYIHDKQYSTKVNRVAHESQAKKKRRKKKVLPSTDEIKKFQNYVVSKREEAFAQLSHQYSYSAWLELAKTTLISIQIFTRRRAGELERTTIDDLKNSETVDENTNPEIYQSLSEEDKKYVGQYTRFVITGKLGRDVPVLLDSRMQECLQLILRYRTATKITPKNPYVFGLPGFSDGRFKYLRACNLMREYSNECGADHPDRLRGTFLRKHMATMCAAQNMDENQVHDIANFMGHAEQIHRSHYRKSVVSRDVVGVAKILRSAIGQSKNDDKENTCSDENSNVKLPQTGATQDQNSRFAKTLCEKSGTNKKRRVIVPESESGSSEEYEPDGEDQHDEADVDEPARKRRKNTPTQNNSTSGKADRSTKRKIRWTSKEKAAATAAFDAGIKKGKLPSTAEMRKFLKNNPDVHRTIAQIRTWASNEKKKYQQG